MGKGKEKKQKPNVRARAIPRAIPVGIPSVFLIGEAVMGMIDLFLLADEINTVRAKKNKSAENKKYENAVAYRQQEKAMNKQFGKKIKDLKKLKTKFPNGLQY